MKPGIVKAACCAVLLCAVWAQGAFERPAVDPVTGGLAGAGLALGRLHGLATGHSEAIVAGLRWEQPYGIPELAGRTLLVGFPVSKYRGLASVQDRGDEAYREQSVALHCERAIQPGLDGSIGLSWHRLTIDGLPTGNAVELDLQARKQVGDDVRFAMAWRNPLRARLSNYEDRLPESLTLGAAFSPDRATTLVLDVEQEAGWPIDVRGGIEMQVLKSLLVRAGTRFDPVEYGAGFTVRQSKLRFHYALNWHRDLGATHALGLDLQWR